MAILRPLNEFARESVVMALEPSRQCIHHCTYCFSTLNSKVQYDNKSKNIHDNSTFESTLSKAYGPSYDPTNFSQWALRNKLVLGYANTVEPFQDPIQGTSILRTCDRYGLPLFIQTKGTNFDEVFPYLKPFHDNSVLFVSFPTPNDQVIRRFEVGAPLAAHRFHVIETAAKAGFHVILALSPYHNEWCDSPSQFIHQAYNAGIASVFFDFLHLNNRQRQAASDAAMVNLADNSQSSNWSQAALDHYEAIHKTCEELEIPIFASGFIPTLYGHLNTLASISPVGVYSRGFQWPYHDGTLFYNLNYEFDDLYTSGEIDIMNRSESDSIVIEWSAALALMELDGRRVDQPFSWSSLDDLMAVKSIPAVWQPHLKPTAPIQELYRVFWNNPSKSQFGWRHPFAKIAMKPDGSPWVDDQGNLVMVFDPDLSATPGKERIIEDIESLRFFDPFNDEDEVDDEEE